MLSLVVEDDAGLRFIYEHILTQAGFKVLLAEDGEKAVEYLNKETPNILFLDILLPRMNGIEVLAQIAKIPRLSAMLIVIVTSNRMFEVEIPQGLTVQFLVKPIRPDQIRQLAAMAIKT